MTTEKVDLLDIETASEESVGKKMLIIIMAIFLHVVPTEQKENFPTLL